MSSGTELDSRWAQSACSNGATAIPTSPSWLRGAMPFSSSDPAVRASTISISQSSPTKPATTAAPRTQARVGSSLTVLTRGNLPAPTQPPCPFSARLL